MKTYWSNQLQVGLFLSFIKVLELVLRPLCPKPKECVMKTFKQDLKLRSNWFSETLSGIFLLKGLIQLNPIFSSLQPVRNRPRKNLVQRITTLIDAKYATINFIQRMSIYTLQKDNWPNFTWKNDELVNRLSEARNLKSKARSFFHCTEIRNGIRWLNCIRQKC